MSQIIETNDGKFMELKTEYDNITDEVQLTDPAYVRLDQALRDWKLVVDVQEVHFLTLTPTTGSYAIEFVDGRTWAGTLDFSLNPTDPLISQSDISDYRETEFDFVSQDLYQIRIQLDLIRMDVEYLVPPP